MKNLIKKVREKVAYERESYRMSTEALEQSVKDFPFPPFRESIRMTEADLVAWRKEQKRKQR